MIRTKRKKREERETKSFWHRLKKSLVRYIRLAHIFLTDWLVCAVGWFIKWFCTATANKKLSKFLSFPQAKMVIGMRSSRIGAQTN